MKGSVRKALKELDSLKKYFDDSQVLSEMISALEPIAKTVLKLGEKNCDLMIAEGSLLFLLKNLERNTSQLAQELYIAVKIRIEKRRHQKLVSSLLFLHSGEFPVSNDYLEYDSKTTIKKTLKELHSRLFKNFNIENENVVSVADASVLDDLEILLNIDSICFENTARHSDNV